MSARGGVAVTGAAGLVGRQVVRVLAREGFAPVLACDVRPPAESVEGALHVQCDVRDPGLAELLAEHRIGSVVHLAAVVDPGHLSEEEVFSIDVLGTRNVLDACLRAGVGHVVVTSSGAAYGYHPDHPPLLREDDALRGNEEFAYARHKRQVEELLADYRARHPELRQLVLRPGAILGPGVRNAITALFERRVVIGVRGEPTPLTFMLDAEVAECIARGVRERRSGVYNLTSHGVMTLREIAAELGKPFLGVPEKLLVRALALLHRLRLTRSRPEQVRFLRHRPVLANDKLVAELYRPRHSTREVFALWKESLDGRHG